MKTLLTHRDLMNEKTRSLARTTAAKCRKAGMDILSCTLEKLADAMAHIIRG